MNGEEEEDSEVLQCKGIKDVNPTHSFLVVKVFKEE